MRFATLAALVSVLAVSAWGCVASVAPPNSSMNSVESNPPRAIPEGQQALVLGGGCFWCIEVLFEELKGVTFVENGYAGGDKAGVTYREIGTGTTGHAEVIRIVYDPKVITTEDLLRIFFTVHDPTTKDRQGGDVGPQYRSVIFFESDADKVRALAIMEEITKADIWERPLVTTLEPLKNYTRAEEYHQDYYAKYETATEAERANMNAGYCNAVISPKVLKFREKFADRLKTSGAGSR
jgi:peptide-methionine (S)-S-oxide reductase